jgi:hypothetical protein
VEDSKISIGDDTATGEPANGPKGPYITDDSDDEMRDATRPDAKRRDESKQDIASTGAPDGTGRQGTTSTQGDGWRERAERQSENER